MGMGSVGSMLDWDRGVYWDVYLHYFLGDWLKNCSKKLDPCPKFIPFKSGRPDSFITLKFGPS